MYSRPSGLEQKSIDRETRGMEGENITHILKGPREQARVFKRWGSRGGRAKDKKGEKKRPKGIFERKDR